MVFQKTISSRGFETWPFTERVLLSLKIFEVFKDHQIGTPAVAETGPESPVHMVISLGGPAEGNDGASVLWRALKTPIPVRHCSTCCWHSCGFRIAKCMIFAIAASHYFMAARSANPGGAVRNQQFLYLNAFNGRCEKPSSP